MVSQCPECSGDLEPEEGHNEHISPADSRWWCDHCQLEFIQDATGLLTDAE